MINQEFLTVILHIYLQQVQLNYKHAKPTHITDAYRNIPCVSAKNYNKQAFLRPFVSVYVPLLFFVPVYVLCMYKLRYKVPFPNNIMKIL